MIGSAFCAVIATGLQAKAAAVGLIARAYRGGYHPCRSSPFIRDPGTVMINPVPSLIARSSRTANASIAAIPRYTFVGVLVLAAAAACSRADEAPEESAPPTEEAHAEGDPVPAAEGEVAEEAPGDGAAADSQPSSAPALASTQPCSITVAPASPTADNECFLVPRLRVAGMPQTVCTQATEPLTFRYDSRGRILTDGFATYEYDESGRASVSGMEEAVQTATLDDQNRILTLGDNTFSYDELGRVHRVVSGDRYVRFIYAQDGTYTIDHNYPDSDEFCESELLEVTGDHTSRPSAERFGHCEINEVPRTLTYTWDSEGRIATIDVDARDDGTSDATITVNYACHSL